MLIQINFLKLKKYLAVVAYTLIPTLGSLRQEDCPELKANPRVQNRTLSQKSKKNWA